MNAQLLTSEPRTSAFLTANAGTGKTFTLVTRVARLLLDGVDPARILCVTYTKAAAAEMQRRLFDTLGGWSVMADADLRGRLAEIGEPRRDLRRARSLFARALETPGGLKIQTLHAFCEKLLRRFPLEAGVSPGFEVLEDAAARDVSRRAREEVARIAWENPDGAIGRAFSHLSVELDFGAFEALLAAFEARRAALERYVETCRARGETVADDVWRRCGFEGGEPVDPEALEADAVSACDWARWREAADALSATGSANDGKLAARLRALVDCAAHRPGSFADCLAVFSTAKGERTKALGTRGLDPCQRDWLVEEQDRLHAACDRAKTARMAVDTVHALTLAEAYAGVYEGEKSAAGALDFEDLTRRTLDLLTVRSEAAWVLYKLDGGIEHVLLDEAQDTSPDQWEIVRALTGEFFSGAGVRGETARPRTVFVVGDEKQSIYSFQGAAPERLQGETQRYDALAHAAEAEFTAASLTESWRSTPQVLAFVDACFASPAMRAAVPAPAGEDVVVHRARRGGFDGQVDLWPPIQDEPADPPDAWTAPVDARATPGARKRLAQRIAAWIAQACARGEAVVDPGDKLPRPMRPGDVLILVRRRDALFEEILRALKAARLPVAGADRLRLGEHVVFADIKALIRFALYPWDDLTLAALLRSPFCEVDEEALFALAHGRTGNLWAELNRRNTERPEWRAAAAFLGWARQAADEARGPFDFLGRAMSRLDVSGRTMRQRLLTRLGPEAEDAVEEMLSEALRAEARGVGDLERFAAELERAELEVKRELDAAGGLVRVMTVHGAKGLEAPVVILPDTTAKPPPPRGALLACEDGGFLFAPRAGDDGEASAAARAQLVARQEEESLRLLYVALTRARDRLIVCGRLSAREAGPAEGSWYAHVAAAFGRPEIAARTREITQEAAGGGFPVTRFGPDPAPMLELEPSAGAPREAAGWLRAPAPPEPPASAYASPSGFAERMRGPAPSPLAAAAGGLGRYRRGELIHRLLQLLPDLAPAGRAEAAARLLEKERDLTPEQRREMAQAALGVLEDARFAAVFGPGGRAEAAVAGGAPDLPPQLKISGRVDRMVVEPDRVLVVDFKTNRPSPDRIEHADPAYLTQMALYVAVLRAIFPDRRVEAALVWTDGPKLMPVPENVIASRLVELRRLR